MSEEAPLWWEGNLGRYRVPAHLEHVVMTVSGWPDKRRRKDYEAFFAWVKEQEDAARAAIQAERAR